MNVSQYFMNDAQYLPIYGYIIVLALLTLALAIFFHELGHWIYFKLHLKKNVKIHFEWNSIYNIKWRAGYLDDYKNLTLRQYKDVNMVGIVAGLLPIILVGAFYSFFFLIAIPYMVGCIGDIKEMVKAQEELDKLNKPENGEN